MMIPLSNHPFLLFFLGLVTYIVGAAVWSVISYWITCIRLWWAVYQLKRFILRIKEKRRR